MIYGMYLSAGGVMASSHRQDVIANNLANAETNAFKRHVTHFQQRLTEAQAMRLSQGSADTNKLLEEIGGGLFFSPTQIDLTQGDLEGTGNSLDVAIHGAGFFSVDDHGTQRLTRDGRFMTDREGFLILASGNGQRVLDLQGRPIRLDPALSAQTSINESGQIIQNGEVVAQLGLFDVPDPDRLVKQGGNLLSYPDMKKLASAADAKLRSQFVERSNVDPTIELVALMEAQRQLEANANMIRYQDQALGKLVNEVGKIG